MANTAKNIPVMEIFGPTIQGEGALTGQVSYFIRTGGCAYRCTWCDQMEAVLPKEIKKNATYLSESQIVEKVMTLLPPDGVPNGSDVWMTLSGGDPLMWNLEYVVGSLQIAGMKVAVETQGTLNPMWLQYVDLITCSPKPPSSGMSHKINHNTIESYHRLFGKDRVVLKVVVFDEKDLDFAQAIHEKWPTTPFYLSVGTPTEQECPDDDKMKQAILKRYRWLADEFLKRPALWGATMGPQMHTFLYAREKGR